MKLLFLGYGRMGSALGAAWLKQGFIDSIVAVDPERSVSTDPRVRIFTKFSAIAHADFDMVVVAVKPPQAETAIRGLGDAGVRYATIISVMAGVPLAKMQSFLPDGESKHCLVRAMPNTPALLGVGCTCLYAPDAGTAERQFLSELFNAVGRSFWVDSEELMDAATAISGSGPAYFHFFSECLINAACALGFSVETATALVVQTAYGAVSQQFAAPDAIADLRIAVTSPGGTTEAALNVFKDADILNALVAKASLAACRKAEELGRRS